MVDLSNFTFNYKIFSGVTLLKVTSSVTLSNITPHNNLLLNSYFKNPTVELHVLYILNMHANFHVN